MTNLTTEAVDAALTAFSDEISKVGSLHKDAMTAALNAAAPFIAAQTLNEAATDWTEHQRANMGKGTVQQISTWLRDRAATCRSEQ